MDITTLTTLLAKWLFPALTGSIMAVWYKSRRIGWDNISRQEKIKLYILGLGGLVLGVVMAYFIGGFAIEFWEIPIDTFGYKIVYLLTGFSGVKIADAIAKNTDTWLDKITEAISNAIDKFTGRFK